MPSQRKLLVCRDVCVLQQTETLGYKASQLCPLAMSTLKIVICGAKVSSPTGGDKSS